MDSAAIKEKCVGFLRKYRYVILVLLVGIVLMLLPSGNNDRTQDPAPETVSVTADPTVDLTAELTSLLSQIQGAGKVQVLLTVQNGAKTVYQFDEQISAGDTGAIKKETVIITDANRAQSGLVQQVDPPRYQGAVVLCQGADSASVRLSIIEAVAKLTGLGTDRICVLKMK